MKKLSLILLVLMLAAAVIGCSSNQEEQGAPAWTITVEGIGDSAAQFTDLDAAKLTMKKVEATLKKKDGSEITQNWEGVPLKEVLEYLGAEDYESVTVEASDGYAKDYSLDIINREETILGLKLEGEALGEEDGPVQAVPTGESGNMWIKNVTKITVN